MALHFATADNTTIVTSWAVIDPPLQKNAGIDTSVTRLVVVFHSEMGD
jgi:hypothetical protein